MTAEGYRRVRRATEALVSSLAPEDCAVQSMPDASPLKWHLAHTSWFFETFLLETFERNHRPYHPRYRELFNSYYEAVGPKHPRPERGHLSRPTLAEVMRYRAHVDERMRPLLDAVGDHAPLVELGLHHEEQHQELMVMDLKHAFGTSPLRPAYRPEPLERCPAPPPLAYVPFEGGLVWIGDGAFAFAFDNERPRHQRFVQPFALASRLVTNSEYRAFVEAGGYESPAHWLSDGWAWVRHHGVTGPLYWSRAADGSLVEYTLHGEAALDPNAPVCHVSAYEAAAYAAWAEARLPTEAEWEVAAASADPAASRWLGEGPLHPRGPSASAAGASALLQLFGDAWEWTRSAYEPYPGFRPARGAVGEYNGKFMSSQWVLRGGCVATPRGHVRATYRNYYYPQQRWPFTGIRLAKEVS